VHAVADGEAAIEHLWDASPNLIVLDLELPRHSAYDVLRHLSMYRPELLVRTVAIIAASSPEMNALVHAVTVGSYLEKPVDAASLRSAVARVAGL
jgi:CheY-like chemotaxis protein